MRGGLRSLGASLVVAVGLAALGASCTVKEPQPNSYFDQTIAPILTTGCVRTNTGAGCHVADAKGNAFGNLNLSTFEGINLRRDLLVAFGPYEQPALLAKTLPPYEMPITAFDGQTVTVMKDVRHVGGPILDPTGSAYMILRRWLDNGATENNGGPLPGPVASLPCDSETPAATGFDPTTDPTAPDFAMFRDQVQPILRASCAAGNCHGFAFNALRLVCGDTPEQVRWNWFAAVPYLGATAAQSELFQRPLGASYHEGGRTFANGNDPNYKTLLAWATQHGPPDPGKVTPGFDFFAHRVQPLLAKKGCMLPQCHSMSSFQEYRLSTGTDGTFSLASTRRNYTQTLAQLAFEGPDVRSSRLVKKNLLRPDVAGLPPPTPLDGPSGGGDGGASPDAGPTSAGPRTLGMLHRGGPVLEDFGAGGPSAAGCDAAGYDYDNANLDTLPTYCVLLEWFRREKSTRKIAPLSAIVYVARAIPSGSDRMQDFDVYSPGSDLVIQPASLDANGNVVLSGSSKTVTSGCGLVAAQADIRRPMVSWDGKVVVFAARSSADQPLAVYQMNADGSQCAPLSDINAGPTSGNGLLVHNFDPAFSPPDTTGAVRIVFASTRGNLDSTPYDYDGPQRTPADPTKPNANLYVYEPDPANAGAMRIRQLTYVLDMERGPSFMADGRVIFTAEKREPGFYQLALRRINLDGGDYHPLMGQRGSIGYHEVSQVVAMPDKNFVAVYAEPGVPHHGGTLGIFNRSIGVDFQSTDPTDYPINPDVLNSTSMACPEPTFFLHALRFPDAATIGRPGVSSNGVYSSPAPLPNDQILVSFGVANDPGSFGGDYDLYVLDPDSGVATKLLGAPGVAEVDAVAVYGRNVPAIFHSQPGVPNSIAINEGSSSVDVTVQDMQTLASLVFQNTPTGRVVENDLASFDVYEELPPTSDVTSFAAGGAFVANDAYGQVYVRRRLLGTVPIASDGSAHFLLPGGVPFVLHLPDTSESVAHSLPRYQREEMAFSAGEIEREEMPRALFDGSCGLCHGSISGRAVDTGMHLDVLTGATSTIAHTAPPTSLDKPPSQRGAIVGPPSSP